MKFSTVISLLASIASIASAQSPALYSNQTTTTLSPSSSHEEITYAVFSTSKGDSTSTVTLLTTITLDDTKSTPLPATKEKVSTISEEILSTITSTIHVTKTISLSDGGSFTTVSDIEKHILVAASTPACIPETVTVTNYQDTKYITVTAGNATPSNEPNSTSFNHYSNTTVAN